MLHKKINSGESVKITYDVQVRNGTQKTVRHKVNEDKEVVDKLIKDNTITLTNITVKVPPIVEVIPEEGGDITPDLPEEKSFIIKKDTEKTQVDITNDPDNTIPLPSKTQPKKFRRM